MMRAALIGIVISGIGSGVCAQPAKEGPTSLESCFGSARAADTICSNPKEAVQRLDCLQKARTVLLECLERVPPDKAAGPTPSEKKVGTRAPEINPAKALPRLPSAAASPESPAATVSPDIPTGMVKPDKPSATASPDKPAATVSSDTPAGMVKPDKPSATVSPDKPAATVSSDIPTGTVKPDKPSATVSPDKPAATVSSDTPTGMVEPDKPAATISSDKPAAAVSAESPASDGVVPPKPRDTNWVVSETTSPVDYSPLITASIRLPSSVKHAPDTLAIRCRGGRTELLVRTEGTWHPSRAGDVQIDYQINDQPVVRLPWTAPADGKTAIYKNDAIGLLQSLPEGARLKINVQDAPGPGHQATFQLVGLNAVREKIAAVCKQLPAANATSSEKH
jgi:hypothetical protein